MIALAAAAACGCNCSCSSAPPAEGPATGVREDRPAEWAQPVERPGLPNLHKVSDALYRGAAPEDEGWAELKAMGIRTVVNLQSFHSDRAETGEHGLGYEHITMKAWHAEYKEFVRFLSIVSDPANQPVFVHCMHGADRTGAMCAAYRVAVQGWTPEEAVRELRDGGYGFHDVWQNLLDDLHEMDWEQLAADAGLAPRESEAAE